MPKIESPRTVQTEMRRMPCLAVSLEDLDRLDPTMRVKLLADKLDLQRGILKVGEDRKTKVPAVALLCDTREQLRVAAMVCDVLRNNDRKQGRQPTGVYVFKESWTRVPWGVQLCVVKMVGDQPVTDLNPEVFGTGLTAPSKPPTVAPTPPSLVDEEVDLSAAKREWKV